MLQGCKVTLLHPPGRILTLPPQHRMSPRDRTASRPRLAARSTAQVALNLFTRAIAFGAAASRGRLAVRWHCQDAPQNDTFSILLLLLLVIVISRHPLHCAPVLP